LGKPDAILFPVAPAVAKTPFETKSNVVDPSSRVVNVGVTPPGGVMPGKFHFEQK
jgi:hypothetical protein